MGVLSPIPQQVCIFHQKLHMLIPLYRLHFPIFFLFRMLSPLSHSKRKTEGVFLLLAHPLSDHTLPRSKRETEGVLLLSAHPLINHTPSLARSVRRRGCFFCRHTPSTPPSLETRDGGGVSSVGTPQLPLPRSTRDGGVVMFCM